MVAASPQGDTATTVSKVVQRISLVALLSAGAMASTLAVGMPGRNQSGVSRGESCGEQGKDVAICGVRNPEDLMALDGSPWVIASSFAKGAIYRIDTRNPRVVNLAETVELDWDRNTYGECPGPLKADELVAHGISIARTARPLLYVVNHGSREAIEVFAVKVADAALTWIGCIPVPRDMMANSVAPLADGSIAVTNTGTPGPELFQNIAAGLPTGEVRRWGSHTGWRIVPGSAGSGPNGIVANRSGTEIFVAMSGTRDIVRLSPEGRLLAKSARLPFMPDNLRWAGRNTLLTTGMHIPAPDTPGCAFKTDCTPPFDVVSIDPRSLRMTMLAAQPANVLVGPATTAISVNGALWIGTFRGDRVTVLPLSRARR